MLEADLDVNLSAIASESSTSMPRYRTVLRCFQRERDTVEIAAMVKYRPALAPTMEFNIEASDLACILPAAAG
jgi:hypothetical protein